MQYIFVCMSHLGFSTEERCVKSVRIESYSGAQFSHIFPHSDWIRRDTYLSVFSRTAEKCAKNADQNNSEYGPFLCGDLCLTFKTVMLNAALNQNVVLAYFPLFYFLLYYFHSFFTLVKIMFCLTCYKARFSKWFGDFFVYDI